MQNKILVTSNDSRIRLYDLDDHTLVCKYRGIANSSSQIKASFSNDGTYIISGSEDCDVYMWSTDYHEVLSRKDKMVERFSGYRRDRNESYETFNGTET